MFPDLDSPDLRIHDLFQIRFHIQTEPGTSKSDEFVAGSLYLFIYAKQEPALSDYQLQITGARINSFGLKRYANGCYTGRFALI